MKIKIEQKNQDKYLLLFSDDQTQVTGIYLSKTELKKLKSNLDQMVEYDAQEVGDSI